MRVRWIFILIIMMLVASIVTSFMISGENNSIVGWIARLSCVLALMLMVIFYWKIMKPLRSITNGVNLLRAQDFSSRLAHVGQRESDMIIDMFNRMMDSLKNERLRMREQNHFLDLLIDVSPMGIVILDDSNRITGVNPSARTFLEISPDSLIPGLRLTDIDTQLSHTLSRLAKGETETVRLSDSMIYRCSRLSFMDKGFAHPFILIEKLTEEVMKAEKKSYEKVIRVIAHEVNNTMAGVNSMLTTAEAILNENQEKNADILEVINVCEGRCRDMSSFITAYANVVKIPEAELISTDLNEQLRRWEIMLESLCLGHRVSLEFHLSSNNIPVLLDPVLMEQVMINIIKNSVESIDSRHAGEFQSVSDTPVGYKGRIIVATSSNPPMITVTDNGAGISDETASMLFSPFFSTKVNGHGIGLLFISEVLHKHGCRFSLSTATDGLTRFKISFSPPPTHMNNIHKPGSN
ncbi:ATP-binding protein [uncultured Duncaniella sp.]|uniref:sensor histidine kinase n=1 Tax=Duncaniella dubosii TaxID=2518971 RepID=UPI00259D316D|nr:ATP-binding protein [uncultured Duncaniella sp.]